MVWKQKLVRIIWAMLLSVAVLSTATSFEGLGTAYATENNENEGIGTEVSENEDAGIEVGVNENADTDVDGKEAVGTDADGKEAVGTDADEKEITDIDAGAEAVVTEPVEFQVPIYNYDVVNVVVPTSYAVALNPYEMTVKTGEDTYSTGQIISKNYGIVNKSTRDKIVTITLQVEDRNHGRIAFVDSAEAALQADKDTYAVYLALIPAADGDIRVNGAGIGKDASAEAVRDVEMNQAEYEVAIQEGINQISFKLSAAVYSPIEGQPGSGTGTANGTGLPEIESLASGGAGNTAFTFGGVMNPNADWSKLIDGLNISVIYTYENSQGGETIAPGTGAMLERQ